jgi:transcriptional regulator NrdR family protein
MSKKNFQVVKSSGEKADFSLSKLRNSLFRSGADKSTVDRVLNSVRDELYQGISTKEIYNRAFALLKKASPFMLLNTSSKKRYMNWDPLVFLLKNLLEN